MTKTEETRQIVENLWAELLKTSGGKDQNIIALGAAILNHQDAVKAERIELNSELYKGKQICNRLRTRLKDQHEQDYKLHALELHLANRNGEIKSLNAKNKSLACENKLLRETVEGKWDADPASRRIREALVQAQTAFITLDEALHDLDVETAQRALGDIPGYQRHEPEVDQLAQEVTVEDMPFKASDASKPATYTRCPHDKVKWLCAECCQVEA